MTAKNPIHPKTALKTCLGGALFAATSLLCMPVLAQGAGAPASPGVQRTYQQELAMCDHIQQDRAACIREAGAARDMARRGESRGPAPDYRANALARCAGQPPADRADCEARVTGGSGTQVQGSVLGGGVIRESVTTVVTPAPPPPPPPAAFDRPNYSPLEPMPQPRPGMPAVPAPVTVPQQPMARPMQ